MRPGATGVAQWQSVYVVYTRPWLQSLARKKTQKTQFLYIFTFFTEQEHPGWVSEALTAGRGTITGRVACAFPSFWGCWQETPGWAAGRIIQDLCLLKLTKKTEVYSVECFLAHNPLVLCTAFYLRDHSNEITRGSN